ncbi:MAG TPA: dockerin type I domain-containing protein [Pirellulaceae bacterium]|nr:dockerin type I domain-containing protein [Pirellulaceae bacterium]
MQRRARHRYKSVTHRLRRLRLESLEPRHLLASASLVSQAFREDDFSLNGTFTYRLHEPDEFDYIDTIDNGRFSSTSGHVSWTSPTAGTGSFRGQAVGDGRATVVFAGRRGCSEYGIEETGGYDFNLDAALSQFSVRQVRIDTSRYTYYRDLTGGFCPRSDPPWFRFFSGLGRNFTGSFSPSDHAIALRYVDDSQETNMNVPTTQVVWGEAAATAIGLQAETEEGFLEVPVDWAYVFQSTEREDTGSFAVSGGKLLVTATISGKPVTTPTPLQAVANFQVFWASSDDDATGPEIPFTSPSAPGIFWNSRQLIVRFEDFPEPPANMTHLRLAVSGTNPVTQAPITASRFVPIERFAARDSSGPAVDADGELDRFDSLLHPQDRANPLVRVLAYQAITDKDGYVVVDDDEGGYYYTPASSTEFQSLAPGQTATDVIRFLAVYNQSVIGEASHTITVRGVNDLPQPEVDFLATTNYTDLSVASTTLLANDVDVDSGDSLRVTSVDATSSYGATITATLSEDQSEVLSIVYQPATSSTLRSLAAGGQLDDYFIYQVADRFGGVAEGLVQVTVTGEDKALLVRDIPPQAVLGGEVLTVTVVIDDPDGDPSDVQLSAFAYDSSYLASAGFQFSGEGGTRQLVIPTAEGVVGRTWIDLTATDSLGGSANLVFALVLGTANDLDLDGVDDDDEDAGPNGGDSNGDGVPDRMQPHVAMWSPDGIQEFTLVTDDGSVLSEVTRLPMPEAPVITETATLATGMLAFGLELNPARTVANTTLWFGQDATLFSRVYVYDEPEAGGSEWESFMLRDSLGARIFADRIEFAFADGGRGDVDDQFQRILTRIGLATVERPWQNVVREDVNNDGTVSPLDALILINQINARGPRGLGTFPSGTDSIPMFLDPSGSNSLEPQDVLIIINYLNGAANTEGEAAAQRLSFVLFPAQRFAVRGFGEPFSASKSSTNPTPTDSTGHSSRPVVPRVNSRRAETSVQRLRLVDLDVVDRLFTELQDATRIAAL